MKKTAFLLPIFLLTACAANVSQQDSAADATGTVTIDGSSTVFPITEAMAEEFQKANPDSKVVVGISGTGGGFKRFCRGETHVNDASRTIKSSEKELCTENGITPIEFPVAFDGIAVMVHPSNDWVDYFTVAELKTIWEPPAEDTVTHWNQIRPEWPDEPISLYGPGVDSGTYDYFTDVVVGEEGASRGDFVASEDDNVLVQGVASDKNSLGFFGYAYYIENADRLKLVPIKETEDANAIAPAPDTINDGSYTPLSRLIFIYVSKTALDDPTVSAFVDFYINPDNASALVSEVGYVPLPTDDYRQLRERLEE